MVTHTKMEYQHIDAASIGSGRWALRHEILSILHGHGLRRAEAQAQVESRAMPAGIMVIPIHGLIMPRGDWLSELFGMFSLTSFRARLREAINNEDVTSVVLDIDSPGGLVDGVPETAAEIRQARETKKIVAVANTEAASAAYWLASQASEIVAQPSAEVGSIGVFMLHRDVSAAMDQLGVKHTFISAGKYKTDGNPYEPLADDARDYLQSQVDDTYDMFTSDVATGRGVKKSVVEKEYGQGRMLGAKAALSAGMIDRIGTLEKEISGRRRGTRTQSHRMAFI